MSPSPRLADGNAKGFFPIKQPSNQASNAGSHRAVAISASMSLQSRVPTAWATNPAITHHNCHTDLHLCSEHRAPASLPGNLNCLTPTGCATPAPLPPCPPAEPDLRIGFRL